MGYAKHQVVVTGIGIICANGKNVKEFWENTSKGIKGIKEIQTVDMSGIDAAHGGEIADYEPENYFTKKELRHMDKAGQFAVIAAKEAIENSKLNLDEMDPYRIGTLVGTSLGGMVSGEKFHKQWIEDGLREADSSLLYKYPIHVSADNVASTFCLKGPKSVISNACAAGTNAVGYATDVIRSGKADVMVAGGVDPLSKLSLSGFNSLQALSPGHCAPYSTSDGINIGEGAAFLILERADFAKERGATILAEVLEYSLSADSYHQTAPDPSGSGALRTMQACLNQSGLKVEDISYINGHGTGTPANDDSEPKAIRNLIKDHNVPVSSTKSMVGHMLGAAGAVEAVISILALQNNLIPPTINFKEEDKQFDMDFVPNEARERELNYILSNSFAFGGNNSTLLLGKYKEQESKAKPKKKKRAVITGVGAVAGNATSVDEIYEKMKNGESGFSPISRFDLDEYTSQDAGTIPELKYRKLINPSLLRRMDTISKQGAVAVKMALENSKIKVTKRNGEKIGLVFATGTGPVETVEGFNWVVVKEGSERANARLFPNTVMNAAAGNIGLNFKIKGPTTTICAGGVSSLNAMYFANNLIEQEICDQVVVVSSDEFNEPLLAGMERIPNYLTDKNPKPFASDRDGYLLGEAGVAYVVESEESAKNRDANILAEIKGFGLTADQVGNGRIDPKGESWKKALELALNDAELTTSDIDFVASAAGGHGKFDEVEANILNDVFGNQVSVGATKSIFGETNGSSGFIGLLSGIMALNGVKPGMQNVKESEIDLDLVLETRYEEEANNILINSFSYGGNYNSLIIGKYE